LGAVRDAVFRQYASVLPWALDARKRIADLFQQGIISGIFNFDV
jgi:hypothetical protein